MCGVESRLCVPPHPARWLPSPHQPACLARPGSLSAHPCTLTPPSSSDKPDFEAVCFVFLDVHSGDLTNELFTVFTSAVPSLKVENVSAVFMKWWTRTARERKAH